MKSPAMFIGKQAVGAHTLLLARPAVGPEPAAVRLQQPAGMLAAAQLDPGPRGREGGAHQLRRGGDRGDRAVGPAATLVVTGAHDRAEHVPVGVIGARHRIPDPAVLGIAVEHVHRTGEPVVDVAGVAEPVPALTVRVPQRLEGTPGAAAVQRAPLQQPGGVRDILPGLAPVEGGQQVALAQVDQSHDPVAGPGPLAGAGQDLVRDRRVRHRQRRMAEIDHRFRTQSRSRRAKTISSSSPSYIKAYSSRPVAMITEYWQAPGLNRRFRTQVAPSSVDSSTDPSTRSLGRLSAWENSSHFAFEEPSGASG